MAQVLSGANDFEKLSDLITKSYKDQAVWFLNAFWDDFAGKEVENVWKYVHAFNELDLQKKEQGNELDELNAHRFLERFHETMTVISMREKLRSTGAIKEERGRKFVSITHYLLVKYNVDWHVLVNAPQGSKEEIEKATRVFQEVQAAFKEAEARKEAATAALKEATTREAEAKRSEAEAKQTEAQAKERETEALAKEAEAKAREGEARAAQDELEAALNELKAVEEAHNNKTAQLQKASEEGGLVSRNKAKAELAQHLSADPLPLRRAKLTQEAAVNKAEKATKVAAEARAVAEQAAGEASQARAHAEEAARQAVSARAEAEQARQKSEVAAAAAEEAVEETRKRVAEAEAYLQEASKRLPHGSTWWLEREIHEAKAYLPKSKGGYQKSK